eukprot:6176461-Pleurochrysis_carterae.AAC.2
MRRQEISADTLYKSRLVVGFCHLYDGQEAVAAGMKGSMKSQDTLITAYRDHCQQLASGDTVEGVLCEMLGRQGGSAKGKGGSMHMYNMANNFYGGHAIVGACVPVLPPHINCVARTPLAPSMTPRQCALPPARKQSYTHARLRKADTLQRLSTTGASLTSTSFRAHASDSVDEIYPHRAWRQPYLRHVPMPRAAAIQAEVLLIWQRHEYPFIRHRLVPRVCSLGRASASPTSTAATGASRGPSTATARRTRHGARACTRCDALSMAYTLPMLCSVPMPVP